MLRQFWVILGYIGPSWQTKRSPCDLMQIGEAILEVVLETILRTSRDILKVSLSILAALGVISKATSEFLGAFGWKFGSG